MHENQDAVSIPALVENYGRMVSSLCRRMIDDEETARDAAQEAWLEIIKSLPSFRGDSKVSTWIYAITCRVVMHRAQAEKIYSTRFLKGYFHEKERDLPSFSHDWEKKLWVKEMCDKSTPITPVSCRVIKKKLLIQSG
ncbi:MAG: sigma-70 family RNA polymerase sigma factor [Chloroflexi bacterium]|nr:sigma-70 family RNA polymerase sigma factor [Chloroflexota bacterium]